MRKLTTHLLWPVIAGILVAVGMLNFFPQLMSPSIKQIEIKEVPSVASSDYRPGISGPVSYSGAVAKAAPAVINIYTRTIVRQKVHPLLEDPLFREFFNLDEMPQKERIQSSLGSGVILSSNGYVLTNNHVIDGADTIIVALKDGRESQASVVGTDPETDLAVLKIDLPDLPSINVAPSKDAVVGDVVLAIGNPFGIGQTVTMGIISATGRDQIGINTFENFIQTDAAINPGNSGGALIDAYGNLLGINTAIFSKSGGSQGIGFAIPSSLAKRVMEQIIEKGKVIRGWLGIEIQEMTPQLAESFGMQEMQGGLIIAGIFRNSPAHQAGLQPGDILTEIGGKPIENSRSAMNQIAQIPPGDRLELKALRNGNERYFSAVIGDRPPSRGP
jgi:serine protease DegS